MTYEEKIEAIFYNRLGCCATDNDMHIAAVKTWLQCEWQCSMIESKEYVALCNKVDEIADRMIKAL